MAYAPAVCWLHPKSQKIESRESLVQQRIEHETSTKDPSRLRPRGTQQERREQRKR